jgi:hypothetical protein
MVSAIPVQFRSRTVEPDQHVFTRAIAGVLDRLADQLQRFGMAAQVGREAAFIANGSREAFLVQQLLQRVKDLGTTTQRLAERTLTHRKNHELLEIETVVGVLATVDDVHHRYRHLHRPRTTKIAVKRQARFLGRGLGHRHRHREHGVGTESRLVVGTVEMNQRLIDERLLLCVEANDRFGNLGVYVLYSLQHALAEVAGGIAIT